MKKILMAVFAVSVSVSLAGAAGFNYEKSKMEGGKSFSEQQIKDSLKNSAEPVKISGDFKKAETAKCNAEAKNYSKPDSKAPPALDTKSADKSNKGNNAEKTGALVGGGIGATAGAIYGTLAFGGSVIGDIIGSCFLGVAASTSLVTIGAPIVIGAVAGAAVGYGLVYAAKKIF